ncbi:DUF742 domain-containing protein [Streptomyces sp. ACA25]|uniref:DUF742 domain-containing protein n=1 Tax=Streptomyces sp. ACA25 TaxID=3022596 RepID=UPI0023077AB8|nr:DUF742 domain-containing protein [Streptomyces sp. ACA25]MDB1087841.1 DUF742 domain-containing protein [Streptomyces sp. ACA25]
MNASGGRGSRERQHWDEGTPVPLYVVTGGRSEAAGESSVLDLVTLVVARHAPGPGMPPEQAAILRMCVKPLSVAEISAYLALPFSTVSVLLADLAAGSHVEIREAREAREARESAPDTPLPEPDIEILKALIDGLQRL